MDNLLDSDVAYTNSEAGSVVVALRAKVARKTNIKQVTVGTDSFYRKST